MRCEYIKNGKRCSNKKIESSNFCRLKSHHLDKKRYDKIVKNIVTKFKSIRIPLDSKFSIRDVISDGACFFRAVAYFLFYNVNKIKNNYEIIRIIKIYNKSRNTIGFNTETEIAKYLQELARRWIINNNEIIIDELGESVQNMTIMSHGIKSLEEYAQLYKIFSGDKKGNIADRWGGTSEQYAISTYFNIPINVYSIQRINKRTLKIDPATPKYKDAYLYLIQRFNHKYSVPDNNDYVINLLLTEKNIAHYQCLISKK